ncbi:MAG: acyl-ACP--UDP-N-acetylglucosamine O-acyltransferase [Stappiaceae bacterium]
MTQIHPTAIVEDGASIGNDVHIGPFCVVGADVKLHDNVQLHSHVAIAGDTSIGAGCKIYPFASVGHAPQDLKYRGEKNQLIIGKGTVIRENATLNPGTEGGGSITRVGDNCLFMVGSHIGHDCQVGNSVIMANNATLAGHVEVGDFAIFGGLSAVHQFVRIGAQAIVGGLTGVEFDVIPFGSVVGDRASLAGLNLVGLKRRGFPREQIHALRGAYKLLFKESGTIQERAQEAADAYPDQPLVETLMKFMSEKSNRGFCTPAKN